MKRLRYSLAAVIGGLTFLFNVERLDLGETNVVDISSFVYVLGFLAASTAVLVAFPFWKGRQSSYVAAFWIAIYLATKLLIQDDRPVWGGMYTYITVTEIAILTVLLVLIARLTQGLHEFEGAVATLTLTEANRKLRDLSEAEAEIQDKLLLSRRHHRPMSVVLLGADPSTHGIQMQRIVEEVQRGMANRYMVARLANVILGNLRRTDLPLQQGRDGRFVIVCPETDGTGARAVAQNVSHAVKKTLGVELDFGVASFPGDAFTFEELLSRAEGDIRKQEPLTPSAQPVAQA